MNEEQNKDKYDWVETKTINLHVYLFSYHKEQTRSRQTSSASQETKDIKFLF